MRLEVSRKEGAWFQIHDAFWDFLFLWTPPTLGLPCAYVHEALHFLLKYHEKCNWKVEQYAPPLALTLVVG
jgi:hypothetical protein